MDKMNITAAKYMAHPITNENDGIEATIEGQAYYIPLAVGNTHYDEIMRQVEAGTLTIADAD